MVYGVLGLSLDGRYRVDDVDSLASCRSPAQGHELYALNNGVAGKLMQDKRERQDPLYVRLCDS